MIGNMDDLLLVSGEEALIILEIFMMGAGGGGVGDGDGGFSCLYLHGS